MLFPSEYITYQNASHKVIHVNMSDSTNLLLDEYIRHKGIEDGLVIRSDYQHNGKGMRNNSWESESGLNLLFSLYHETKAMKVNDQFYISKVVAIALAKSINHFLEEKTCQVKWPNDAFILGKKIGGILIQNSIREHEIQYCIIGIGININQEKFKTTENATSFKLNTGENTNLDEILNAFLIEWDKYSKLLYPLDKNKINALYFSLMYGFKEWLNYKSSGNSFEGKIVGVKDNGHLIVKMRDGQEKYFDLKEISLVQG